MSDATDDAEDAPYRGAAFCNNPAHKGYRILWIHECKDCLSDDAELSFIGDEKP